MDVPAPSPDNERMQIPAPVPTNAAGETPIPISPDSDQSDRTPEQRLAHTESFRVLNPYKELQRAKPTGALIDVGGIIGQGSQSAVYGAVHIDEDGNKRPAVVRVHHDDPYGSLSDAELHKILYTVLGPEHGSELLPELLGVRNVDGRQDAIMAHEGMSLDKASYHWHERYPCGLRIDQARGVVAQFAATAKALADMAQYGYTLTDMNPSNIAQGHHLHRSAGDPLKLIDIEGVGEFKNHQLQPVGSTSILYTTRYAPPEVIAHQAGFITVAEDEARTTSFAPLRDDQRAEAVMMYQLGHSLIDVLLNQDPNAVAGQHPLRKEMTEAWVDYTVNRSQNDESLAAEQRAELGALRDANRLQDAAQYGGILYGEDYEKVQLAVLHGGVKASDMASLSPDDLDQTYLRVRSGTDLTPYNFDPIYDMLDASYGDNFTQTIKGATAYRPEDRMNLETFAQRLTEPRAEPLPYVCNSSFSYMP